MNTFLPIITFWLIYIVVLVATTRGVKAMRNKNKLGVVIISTIASILISLIMLGADGVSNLI